MNQQQLQTNEAESSSFSTSPALAFEIGGEATGAETGTEIGVEQDTTAPVHALPALLQQEATMRRRETIVTLAWAVAFWAAMVAMTRRLFTDPAEFSRNLGLCFLLMVLMGAAMVTHFARRSYRRKRALAHALAQTQNKERIGLLIESTRVENTHIRNLAKQSLIRLLPTMQASDATLLTDAHRDRLLRFLAISPTDKGYQDLTELFSPSARQRETDLRLAILKALEQVGGAKELPVVERLSHGRTSRQSGFKVPQEVKDAANECLPYLQGRAREQRASEQLLRASSAHTAPNDTLLRPTEARTDSAPEQLLRASETV